MSPPIQQQYYLIGSPVSHSLSPVIHNTAFAVLGLDLHYVTQDVSDEALGDIVERIDGVQVLGANVTIPHKEAIIPFLDGPRRVRHEGPSRQYGWSFVMENELGSIPM